MKVFTRTGNMRMLQPHLEPSQCRLQCCHLVLLPLQRLAVRLIISPEEAGSTQQASSSSPPGIYRQKHTAGRQQAALPHTTTVL